MEHPGDPRGRRRGGLILVGIAGFFAGDVLLVFGINPLHNVVHLALGVVLGGVGYGMAK